MNIDCNKKYIVYFMGWRSGFLKSYITGVDYFTNRPFIQVETTWDQKYGSFTDIVPRLNLFDIEENKWVL